VIDVRTPNLTTTTKNAGNSPLMPKYGKTYPHIVGPRIAYT
jgi:hypothetical protein